MGVRVSLVSRSVPVKIVNRSAAILFACLVAGGLSATTAAAQNAASGSDVAARAYLIADDKYGHILASAHAEDKLQVGSLTKIATAVVAFDWARLGGHTLDQSVPITARALTAAGENPVGYQAGDELTMRDLLYAALLQSDNAAAESLAEFIGKGLPIASEGGRGAADTPTVRFVAQMNALARQLNMTRTRFLNPTGFDNVERPYSTALDMARLTRHALTKAEFRFFIAQKERRITIHRADQTSEYMLRNTNELLGTHKIDGVKTGQTTRAGGCLIISATRDPVVLQEGNTPTLLQRRLIVVLLGSPDRFHEATRLLGRGESLFDAWAAAGRILDPKSSL
jgi:D-alanyl-D-alanine carboxypeptidase